MTIVDVACGSPMATHSLSMEGGTQAEATGSQEAHLAEERRQPTLEELAAMIEQLSQRVAEFELVQGAVDPKGNGLTSSLTPSTTYEARLRGDEPTSLETTILYDGTGILSVDVDRSRPAGVPGYLAASTVQHRPGRGGAHDRSRATTIGLERANMASNDREKRRLGACVRSDARDFSDQPSAELVKTLDNLGATAGISGESVLLLSTSGTSSAQLHPKE